MIETGIILNSLDDLAQTGCEKIPISRFVRQPTGQTNICFPFCIVTQKSNSGVPSIYLWLLISQLLVIIITRNLTNLSSTSVISVSVAPTEVRKNSMMSDLKVDGLLLCTWAVPFREKLTLI